MESKHLVAARINSKKKHGMMLSMRFCVRQFHKKYFVKNEQMEGERNHEYSVF